jgi:16S rRNA (cytosine967-C5)-methyltransferase
MTPGARIQAAIELTSDISKSPESVDKLIAAYFKRRRYAGSKDRRAIAERVYGLVRKQARLNWWTERTGQGIEPTARRCIIADLALSEKLQPVEISALFSGQRHCPPPLEQSEQDLAEALAGRPLSHHADMPDWVASEYPQWMDGLLKDAFADNLVSEMTAMNQPAPLDLRVNTVKSSVPVAADVLHQVNIETAPCPWSPLALRVVGHAKMGGIAAYRDGLVEIQDEGSQLLAMMCDARPGLNMIDFCAGAGGKTLALGAAMTEQGILHGKLVACDVFERRLSRIIPRIERAGLRGVTLKVLAAQNDPWITENAATADRVLLDVPCTATGTWRRAPNARWRLLPNELDELIIVQRQILEQASALVKPGGWLVYATCSVLHPENQDQIQWFLEHNEDFEIMDAGTVWHQCIGDIPAPLSGPFLRLTPATTLTDGFFCAILQRRLSP